MNIVEMINLYNFRNAKLREIVLMYPGNYEAFVYEWINPYTLEWYVGWHKIEENDAYIASGKYFLHEYYKGPSFWVRTILMTGSAEEAQAYESKVLCERNAKDDPLSLNRTNNTFPYYTLTDKDKAKMRAAMRTTEARAKMSALKRKHFENPEARAKHLAALQTPEARAKRSALVKKYYENPEARAKVRAAMRTPEARAKMSALKKKHFENPETRAKHLAALQTPEVRAKRSALKKKHWAKRKKRSQSLEDFFA